MRRRLHIRFRTERRDPLLLESSLGGDRLMLTLPALPDRTLRQCDEFLRELLDAFEEEYQEPLARSYGWSLNSAEEPDDEEEEDI